MKYKTLDAVVLNQDLPQHELRARDLGRIVEIYEPDGLDVEFVTASGRTEALVTLSEGEVRPVRGDDLISVRQFGRSA